MRSAGLKWVSGFPGNGVKGLPYISGLLMLNDPDTGICVSVMDCVWITAKRTAAASAISAKFLARPDSSVVGILGCGVQGRTHVEALRELFPVKRVMAFDVSDSAAIDFADDIRKGFDVEVVIVDSPRSAVSACDIVVTAGPILKTPHATIQAGWLDRGSFASLVDFDSYWHPSALAEADRFCTDDIAQLEHYRKAGYFQLIPPVYSDLGDLVTGKKPGRQSAHERNMTCNLGLAIEDMAVAPLVLEKALKMGIGTRLPL
jgi:ornithine cyclodeaminase/alanine dehydrogenase